jgi:hypothetical protein
MANKKLLQITDNGPVKVLGRGTNGWTEKWGRGSSENKLESDWDLWKDFPTAVQVGDLIWVMKDCIDPGTAGEFNHYWTSRWTLAAINVREGGTNVAYPGLTNNTDVGGTSIYQDGSTRLTLSNPTPYLNITYPNGVAINSQNYSSRMLSHRYYNSNRAYPQFTGSDVTHYFTRNVTGNPDTGGSSDFVHGLGYKCGPHQTTGEAFDAAMIFPPIRYKWQFEELYGKESDWVTITSDYDIWKDTYPSGTTDKYPYAFEEPSESLFRDVPGDTTGDGVDDSAIAVAALAAASITLPSLDVSKCKLDIKTKALDDTFSSLKDSLLGAVDTSGLSALASKATELKDSLLSNLPELPEFPDFASQFASLDFNNPIDVEAFKDKWGNIVSGIDGMIDKVKFDPANLDICAVSDIKAEVQEDGSYSKVVAPPPVVVPREKPADVKKTVVVTEEAKEKPQSAAEKKFEVNAKLAKSAKNAYLLAWKKLSQDPDIIAARDLVEIEAAVERRIELRRDEDYIEFKRRVSEKKPLGDLIKYVDEEEKICKVLDFANTYRFVLQNAQHYITNHVLQYAGYFYSTNSFPDYANTISTSLTRDKFPRLGVIFYQFDAVRASYNQANLDKDLAFVSLINNKVEEYIWKEDIIKNYAINGITYPRENTNLTQETPTQYVT